MSSITVSVLIAGEWRTSKSVGTFQACDPGLGELLPKIYPVSSREEVIEVVRAGSEAADSLRDTNDEKIADFLDAFAAGIERCAFELVELANVETGLSKSPRLKDVELPRTTKQVRQAANAARKGTWRRPILDVENMIYSVFAPLGGPVVVMGPNNFPFAFNSAAGGDFVAAIAAHNPVIAKANPSHPGTTKLFAEVAHEAIKLVGLHPATLQLIYRVPAEVGLELVSHRLVGATGFTGSRNAGLALKAAADGAGRPIYLEMSSVNPVVILEGALRERGDALAEEFLISCTMGAGQFCTKPGFIVAPESEAGRRFVDVARQKFEATAPGVLLGRGSRDTLCEAVTVLQNNGAKVVCGGRPLSGPSYRFANTLLTISGADFLQHPRELQTEAFGPVALIVFSCDTKETVMILQHLEGNLTGTIYSDITGLDDADYAVIEPHLRQHVGRLNNDKMPTGVVVSPAMNHGGPFPAAGHPGFTAVGIPTSIQRFAALHCYDNVRPNRLPAALQRLIGTA